jgi:phage gp37-like protein
MRKFLLAVGATALALAGASCGLQSFTTTGSRSSSTTRTMVIAAPAAAVSWAGSVNAPTVIAAPAAAVSWAGPVNAPSARSIVGTWSGHITRFPGSGASRQRFAIVVARGERAGTWRIGLRCAGTLRLKDISNGYHHYYRVAGANAGCAALGVDCLKRVGAQMVDVFVPHSGPDDSVNLRRVG